LLSTEVEPELEILLCYAKALTLSQLADTYSSNKKQEQLNSSAEAAAIAAAFLRLPRHAVEAVLPQEYWTESIMTIFAKHSHSIAKALLGAAADNSAFDVTKPIPTEDDKLRAEWEEAQKRHNFESDAMDELIGMAALHNLKRQMLAVIDRVHFNKARGTLWSKNSKLAILGN